jgi:xylose isomerase
MLGSIDSNTGDPLLGWDTDQFPMNLQDSTAIMSIVVVAQGGFTTGGLNFDCKVRRESVDPSGLFNGLLRARFAQGGGRAAGRYFEP